MRRDAGRKSGFPPLKFQCFQDYLLKLQKVWMHTERDLASLLAVTIMAQHKLFMKHVQNCSQQKFVTKKSTLSNTALK
jgi:hypothetical protein